MTNCNYANRSNEEILRARKLVNISLIRLELIKKRFENGNKNHEDIVKKTNRLIIEYQLLDKEVKRYEYN